ncbi:MAG: putative alkylation repair enzyme [Marmoricola sp.]|nr:putative alkylation repair enzyme [Marmoricola sp.]
MTDLGDEIRAALAADADPELVPAMAAYMKVDQNGGLGFLGLRRPAVRRIARNAARAASDEQRLAAVVDLWDEAWYREERYAAQDLLGLRWTSGRLDLLDLHRRMAATGAWWDHVDEVAHRIADLVATHPVPMAAALKTWSTDEDRWVRRLAIIGQLGLRERIDLDLLADVVAPNTDDPEFFVRKAIGWALRDAARTHPAWVRTFADTHDLSPLSRREALKHLP